ncbi:MAG: lysophospholipid acyltransferase family protein [Bacteroidales bacterium]
MRFRLEYGAVLVVRALVGVAPWPVVRAVGRSLGLLFYLLDRKHRQVTLDNLARAFPARSARERRGIARRVFGHFGRLLFDLIKFSTLTRDEMLARVEFEGDERIVQAQASGCGYFIFSGHFGFWELQALVHALRLGPLGMMVRPLNNPYLDALLTKVREATGNTVIDRSGGVRRVLRELQANHGVAVLIDQHIHTPDAVYVDFFERPAATTSLLGALARRTGAAAVPVFSIPLPDGRYRMIYDHPVPPPKDESREELVAFTQRCTDVLEMYVRRHPDLWLWMHRRWRDV